MLLSILPALAAEIGTDLKLGVGAQTGDIFLAVNAKYFLGSRFGLSASLGSSIWVQRLRLNAELDLARLKEWPVGDLELYLLLGVDGGLGTRYLVAPEVGAGIGAGIALRFASMPAEAYFDVGVGGYPVCYTAFQTWCYVQPRGDLGFRWYVL